MKRLTLILSCVLLFAGIAQAAEKPVIRIGARVFTEQTLLAEITSQYLRAKGYDTQVTGGLGSLIFPGIALNNQPQLLLGAACTALLALLLDGLVTMASRLWLERGLRPS